MTIEELGAKYGFDQEVHFVILDKDIEQILEEDGIMPADTNYQYKKDQVSCGLQEMFDVFLDTLERIIAHVKVGASPEEIREIMQKRGYLKKRRVSL